MADLSRSAKSGNDWAQIDLAAYNIIVQLEDAPTFFGVDPLPPSPVDQEMLTTQNGYGQDMVSIPQCRVHESPRSRIEPGTRRRVRGR